jgi:rod shape-determining protein MreD
MAGIMPNLYVIFVLFIGLFAKRKMGLTFGIIFGMYLDVIIGESIGVTGIMLGIIGMIGEILSKNFSKDSKFTIMLMVFATTALYEIVIYIVSIAKLGATLELVSFIKILIIEILFNEILTIIFYPLMKKAGYYLEDLFEEQAMITRFF